MQRVKIGITVGDINGIGLEVILKAVSDRRVLNFCIPIVYGASKVVSYHKNIVHVDDFPLTFIPNIDQLDENAVNVINCWNDNAKIALGQVTQEGGQYAMQSLDWAVEDWKNGRIDALVTAPIHKKAMQLAGFPHTGHTEYLTSKLGMTDSLMLMVHDQLRVGLVTNHIPISQVAERIQTATVLRKIQLFHETLRRDFGVHQPKIAVLGLNPHAGDEGAIGNEDLEQIYPAIQAVQDKGWKVWGPYPADGFFGSGNYQQFDGVLAMYHDQGLVPFKTLAFEGGVNYTAGLPFVRTSPDHGTGFNIAGQNIASPDSFLRALFLATDIILQRANYAEMTANPLAHTTIEQSDEEILSDSDEETSSRHQKRRDQGHRNRPQHHRIPHPKESPLPQPSEQPNRQNQTQDDDDSDEA